MLPQKDIEVSRRLSQTSFNDCRTPMRTGSWVAIHQQSVKDLVIQTRPLIPCPATLESASERMSLAVKF